MTFAYRKEWMAQVLSIIGEGGVNGIEYNGIIGKVLEKGKTYQSKRFRFSLVSAKEFSQEEFENYLKLAWRFGFVHRSNYSENENLAGLDKSSYKLEDEIVKLTREGWEYLDEHYQPLLHRWWSNILENIPTVILSVLSAICVSWISYHLRPTDVPNGPSQVEELK